jgi:SP family general alpha glucoside:H+ symporter-like MFS transporter
MANTKQDFQSTRQIQVEDVQSLDATTLGATAQLATDAEHSLTLRQAFKKYPAAIFWAVVMSFTIVMEGYDSSLINNFFAYPSFVRKYGTYYADLDAYEISGPWQTAMSIAAVVGAVFGLLLNGIVTEKFGHRHVILVSLLVMTAIVFFQFFAPSIQVLMAGQVLVGIPWGIFAVMGPSYASEVCPLALRGYLTSFVNLCWIIGQFIAAGVVQGLVNNTTEWSYKIPFAIQWWWPVPLFVLTYLAPDSPWWLVRKERYADAQKSIIRLSSGLSPEEVQQKLAMIVHTNNFEKALQTESSYRDCFRLKNLRRTEIACMSLCSQCFSGEIFAYGSTYFLVQAGLKSSDAYKMNFGATGLAFLATCSSWVLMTFLGRRTIFITGLGVITVVLLAIGVLAYPAASNNSVVWVQGAMSLVWLGVYSLSLGPQSFAITAEISATRVRAQTISIARNSYYLVTIIGYVAEAKMINPTEDNLKGRTSFIWSGLAVLALIWAIFRLPETKGRTYEELDNLFEKNIPAWKFASTDAYEIGEVGVSKEFQD